MGGEINSPSVLISMLLKLRQENKQLADELSTAQMLLRTLQATAASGPLENDGAQGIETTESHELPRVS